MNYHQLKELAKKAELVKGKERKRLVEELIIELPKNGSLRRGKRGGRLASEVLG